MIVPDEPAESCAVVSGCVNCAQLLKENRQLTNRVKTLRELWGNGIKKLKHIAENVRITITLSFPYINLIRAFVIYCA